MTTSYNKIASQCLERIASLSDGLFAIAMTLIVLEIHIHEHTEIHSKADLWRALVTLSPRLLTYLMSFLTLGIFWAGQQTQLNYFKNNRFLHGTRTQFSPFTGRDPIESAVKDQSRNRRAKSILKCNGT
jgi:hypothetical protein